MATSTYLFNHNENTKYNDVLDYAVIGYPIRISINWQSLPLNFQSDIDDIINANDYLYFFKKDKYIKFSLIHEAVVAGPAPIIDGWPGLAGTGFEAGIDAAAEWPDVNDRSHIKTVLFTKDSDCILYNLEDNTIKKTDISTQLNISAFPYFCSDLDSINVWKSIDAKFAYIFKGEYNIRYNFSTNTIDTSTTVISKNWHGVNFTEVQAAVSVDNDVMGSCCRCGEVENGQYDFQIPPDTEFGLIAYANSERQQTVSVYVDDQLVDAFSGKGDGNTIIGIRTYPSGTGKISIHMQKEGAEPGRLNFSYNRLDRKSSSITISSESDAENGVPDCTVIINTPLS
jgi:mannose-binding lectin